MCIADLPLPLTPTGLQILAWVGVFLFICVAIAIVAKADKIISGRFAKREELDSLKERVIKLEANVITAEKLSTKLDAIQLLLERRKGRDG